MSGLFGTKERFPKSHPVYEALGSVDELNSFLGVCRFRATGEKGRVDVAGEIMRVQECLFVVQAELGGAEKSIARADLDHLEEIIEHVEQVIHAPRSFVIPGATEFSALCDFARALSRRAERAIFNVHSFRDVSPVTLSYINRLSSFLYALARYDAAERGVHELSPLYESRSEITV